MLSYMDMRWEAAEEDPDLAAQPGSVPRAGGPEQISPQQAAPHWCGPGSQCSLCAAFRAASGPPAPACEQAPIVSAMSGQPQL